MNWAKTTRVVKDALSVSSQARTPSTTCCIQRPMFETNEAASTITNCRLRNREEARTTGSDRMRSP